jgi:transcription elongation factor GreA
VTEPPAGEKVSQKAFDRMREEYEYLNDVKMPEIAKKIGQARDEGDLSENAGYHAAREEQAQLVARIRELKHKIDTAQVGEVRRLTIAFFGDPDDTETFILGSREMIALDDSIDIPVYSPESPLGQAVADAAVGDEVSYVAPNGKTISVTIVSSETYDG